MSRTEIQTWMSYYDISPSVKLFDHVSEEIEEEVELRKIIEQHEMALNPINVVFESLVNVLQEKRSMDELTESQEKTMVTEEVKKRTFSHILSYFQEEREEKIRELHSQWLTELQTYLRTTLEKMGNLHRDEVLYRISNRYRISGNSAILAILSLSSY